MLPRQHPVFIKDLEEWHIVPPKADYKDGGLHENSTI